MKVGSDSERYRFRSSYCILQTTGDTIATLTLPTTSQLISKRNIPRSAQTLATAYIVAFGSAGSALFPLIVGFNTQTQGIESLTPTLRDFLTAQIGFFLSLGLPKRGGGEAARAID